MAVSFISARIWPRLRRLAKARNRRGLVAVPFLTTGAARRLPLRSGDLLVTKFDRAAVRAGLVDPREVVTFIKRGVEVHSVTNLHAKVYVFGRTAVVGSANVSSLSESYLVEAGCELTDFKIVADCRDFIRGLRGEIVELKFAQAQIPFWRPPQSPFYGQRGRTRSGIQQSNLVAVQLSEVDYDQRDQSAVATGHKSARRKVKDRKNFRLDDFRWDGSLPKVLRKGVRVLMCTKPKRGGVYVTAPGRVLELRRYRSARGSPRTIVVVEMRKRVRDKPMTTVLRALGPESTPLRSLKRTKVLRNATLIYRLGQLWPTL